MSEGFSLSMHDSVCGHTVQCLMDSYESACLKVCLNIFHFWTRIIPKQSVHRHYNAWGAKSTLGTMRVSNFLLHLM